MYPEFSWLLITDINMKKWILSLIASSMFAWAVSYCSLDSVSLKSFDEAVNRFTLEPDTVVRMRSEGWANSHIGPHGTTGMFPANLKARPIIAIWGDSYIESFQVSDAEKAGTILTTLCTQKGNCDHIGMNIGMSGQSIADYYFSIPGYEFVFGTIGHHYIVLGSIMDVLPDQSGRIGRFISAPEFSLKKIPFKQGPYQLKSLCYTFRLDFLWKLTRKLSKLDFSEMLPKIGPKQKEGTDDHSILPVDHIAAWDFLLPKISDITQKSLTFVYCPTIPVITASGIELKNPKEALARTFERMCHKYGLGFIDIGDDFIRHYQRTGTFPRGFFNSQPSKGHMNAQGHRLLAEAIFKQINRDTNEVRSQ